jgi:enterochelin esterase-like enzyme
MKKKIFITCSFLLVSLIQSHSQDKVHSISFKVSVAEYLESSFYPDGRLFVFLTTDPKGQPADMTWPFTYGRTDYLFARNYFSWNIHDTLEITDGEGWSSWCRTDNCSFNSIPEGAYYVQFLWQQVFDGFATTEDGNIRSQKQELQLTSSQTLEVQLGWLYEAWKPEIHPHVKLVQMRSDTLSKWWGKSMYEYAAVLLPSGYFDNPNIEYPVYYYIGGGDSDCLAAARQMHGWKRFADWWMDENAPQLIVVYLDGNKNRNIYHLDSDNLGPHGYSLVNEFIPYIENQYRGSHSPDTRFIGGCSTGGYGSLALQLFYPETFNGVFCYSPDPISFNELMTINIYEHKNLFYDEFGYPAMLNQLGRADNPISWRDWVAFENVLGHSETYLNSDHMLSIWSAIFGPKGENGLPVPMVDPLTGDIDKKIAERWSRYDLSKYIADNWNRIGPDLQGKIYISCNVNDNHFLDRAVRVFESTLDELTNPEPDAVIEWALGNGHCSEYNHMAVIKRIEERSNMLNTSK